MDYDEAFTYLYFAVRPLKLALADYSLPNNHLFHTLLVHFSTGLLGNHPWTVRLPAFLAGVALVPATYWWARRFFNGWAGLLAAALVACSWPLVGYSTNARGYTILGLCFVAAFALAARAIEENRASDWVFFAAVSAVGLYTVPTMLYGFLSIAVWIALEIFLGRHSPPRRSLLRNAGLAVAGAAVVAAAAYAPIWLRAGFKLVTAMALESMPWRRFRFVLAEMLEEIWPTWFGAVPSVAAWGLAASLAGGMVFHRKLSRYRVSPAMVSILVPGILVFSQRTVPFARVWLYLLPICLATAAAGIVGLLSLVRAGEPARRIVLAALPLAAAAWLGTRVMANSRGWFDESGRTDRISDFLIANLKKGDFFGSNGYYATPIAYYFAAGGLAASRVSPEWHLEILRVETAAPSAEVGRSSRPPRAFFLVRDDDVEVLRTLRQRARSAGVASHLRRHRRFGTTTIYEEPDLTFGSR